MKAREQWLRMLDYHSSRIFKIAIPVTLTLVTDAALVRFLEGAHGSISVDHSLSSTMAYNQQGVDTSTSIYLAIIVIGSILSVTAVLFALYYFGCVKLIMGWMTFAVSAILSYYVVLAFGKVPKLVNSPMDYIGLVVFLLNLVVVGDMAVFWRAPLIVTQFFLVIISIMISIVFLTFPDWTIWILMSLLIIYDCCMVLLPHGLLKMLIKKSEERGDAIPALIYSSAAWLSAESNEPKLLEECSQEPEDVDEEENQSEEPSRGVKLGLGDFCFYGILVTRAARVGWDLVILCVFAVLLGLSMTLLALLVLRRPLPALPFSLLLGMFFFVIGAVTFRRFGVILRYNLVVF